MTPEPARARTDPHEARPGCDHRVLHGREGLTPFQCPDCRAWRALAAHLSAGDRKRYLADGWVDVHGSLGGWYRLSRAGGVWTLDREGGYMTGTWCGGPRDGTRLPYDDRVLAIMLIIRADEAHWLDRANYFGPQSSMAVAARAALAREPRTYGGGGGGGYAWGGVVHVTGGAGGGGGGGTARRGAGDWVVYVDDEGPPVPW